MPLSSTLPGWSFSLVFGSLLLGQLERSLFHVAGISLQRLGIAQVVAGQGILAPHADRGCRLLTAGKFRRNALVAQFDQGAKVTVLDLPTIGSRTTDPAGRHRDGPGRDPWRQGWLRLPWAW